MNPTILTNERVESVLINASLNGSGSHFICDCPFCEKKQHMYVQRATYKTNSRGVNISFMFNCKKCSEGGTIVKLLRKIGRLDLIEFSKSIETANKLTSIDSKISLKKTTDLSVPNKALPIGFIRIKKHEYLDSRGFTVKQYKQHIVGVTERVIQLKGYLIFSVIENGECKGYVARHTWTKQELKDYNEMAKEKGMLKKLRYSNSIDTDFSKLLFGIDEIKPQSTVILVEGVFDKFNVDRMIDELNIPNTICVGTFGKKISEDQVAKLKNKDVSCIVLMFDPDAINDAKRDSFKLLRHFPTVKVATLREKDPGDLSVDEFREIMDNIKSPLIFHLKTIKI